VTEGVCELRVAGRQRSAFAVLAGRAVVRDDVVVRVGGEADLAASGRGWRLHKLAEGFEDGFQALVVYGELGLDFGQLERELALVRGSAGQTNEGANHKDADFDGPGRVKYGRCHHGPVLGERVGTVLVMLAAL